MGQIQSKTMVKEGWFQKFGRVEFIENQGSQIKTQIRVSLESSLSQQQLSNWENLVKQLQNNPQISKYIVLPLRFEENNCFVCTSNGRKNAIKLYYNKLNCSLSQQIRNRRETQKYFEESQLWYLLYVLVRVAAFFEEKSFYLGNVHPSNVILNEMGRILIFTSASSPNQPLNIQKIKHSKYQDIFIAPEQIKIVNDEHHFDTSINELNQNKIDLFNIGLVLLEAILLKDCYYLYERTKFSFRQDNLISYKEQLINEKMQYSQTLINFVNHFLTVDYNQRNKPSYYYKLLKSYETQILALKVFETKNLNDLQDSPQVMNYLERTSPNTRQTKYLSLAKKIKEKGKQSTKKTKQASAEQKKQVQYIPIKINRKLFKEEAEEVHKQI